MDVTVIPGSIQDQSIEAIAVNLFEGVKQPGGATGAVDRALSGAISDLIAGGDFSGKRNEVAVLYPRSAIATQRVLVVGLGKAEEFTLDRARQASASVAKRARDLHLSRLATVAHGAGAGGLDAAAATQAVVEGAVLGSYSFNEYRTSPSNGKPLAELVLVERDETKLGGVEQAAKAGQIIASAANYARDLVNQPPNVATPTWLADQARQVAEQHGLEVTVLGPDDMSRLGMGALLGVARGSEQPAQFIILDYHPGKSEQPPMVIAGKGVTFDTGGYSLKTFEGMADMKSDMAGAAAVVATLRAVSELDLSLRVIGLAPASENRISGGSYLPSDVLRAMNGKMIEVISTDAEGRLLLADALTYADRYHPQAVIDLATLTGACVIALGEGQAAGMFSNQQALADQLKHAAEVSGERLWQLPLYEEYLESIRSDVADVKNSGGRMGGVGTSAIFLREFIGSYPWAHLDIAPMAYNDKAQGYVPKGGTGYGVRLLVAYLRAVAGQA